MTRTLPQVLAAPEDRSFVFHSLGVYSEDTPPHLSGGVCSFLGYKRVLFGICFFVFILLALFSGNADAQIQWSLDTVATEYRGAIVVFPIDMDRDGDIDIVSTFEDIRNSVGLDCTPNFGVGIHLV